MEGTAIMKDLAPYVVGLIAFLGAYVTAWFAFKANNKNLLIKTVTNERSVWRKELREYCSEFVKLVYEQINNSSASNKPRINELKVHIRLRVNPNPGDKHILDKEIIRLSQELVVLIDKDFDKGEVEIKLVELELNIQRLLKQEWDKSKKEAVKGEISIDL